MLVYVVTDGELIKIGVTRDLARRMETLQTGNGKRLDLIAVAECGPTAYQVEQGILQAYAHTRTIGEWLDIEPRELVDVLERLGERERAQAIRATLNRDDTQRAQEIARAKAETLAYAAIGGGALALVSLAILALSGALALPAGAGLPAP